MSLGDIYKGNGSWWEPTMDPLSPRSVRKYTRIDAGGIPIYRWHQPVDLCPWITEIEDGYHEVEFDLEVLGREQRNTPKILLWMLTELFRIWNSHSLLLFFWKLNFRDLEMYFKENLRIVVCLLIIKMLLNNVHDWLQSFPLPLYTPSAIYICLVYLYLPDLDLCLGQWNVVERVEPSLKG